MENPLHIEKFDDFDEMFSQLQAANDRAFRSLHDQQRAITWGRHVIAPTSEYLIFGKVPTTVEYLEAEGMQDASTVDKVYALENLEGQLQRAQLYGQWYSRVEPDGEWEIKHALSCWPITGFMFDAARVLGWEYDSFPKPLADEFTIRMSMMQDHLDMVREGMS